MQLLRVTRGPVVLIQTRAVLISTAQVTTKTHVDARGLPPKAVSTPLCARELAQNLAGPQCGDGDGGSGRGEEQLALATTLDDFQHGGKQRDSSSLRGLATRNLTMLSEYVDNTKWTFFPLGGGHAEGVGMRDWGS